MERFDSRHPRSRLKTRDGRLGRTDLLGKLRLGQARSQAGFDKPSLKLILRFKISPGGTKLGIRGLPFSDDLAVGFQGHILPRCDLDSRGRVPERCESPAGESLGCPW